MEAKDGTFQSFADIVKLKKPAKKAPAYPWQDLALQVIKDLAIPGFKRSAVFKACRDHSKQEILTALNDTKELCSDGAAWKYFFKVVGNSGKPWSGPETSGK